MLPSLTTNLVQAVVACGACADAGLLSVLPFLAWWVLLFVGWGLLVGPLVFRFVNAYKTTELRNPVRQFFIFFGLLLVSVIVTQGSLLLPFLLFAPFWIQELLRGIWCQSLAWRKFSICVVGVMLLVVPVSYVFPIMQKKTPHDNVAVPSRTTPAIPSTAPAPAPTKPPSLQDALPPQPPRAP